MRDFPEIERELNLVEQGFTPNGTLFVSRKPGTPRIVVRRFDGDPPAAMIPAYASLLRAASIWIEHDRELAAAVRIEQPVETGNDFIARKQPLGTRLSAYLKDDERVPPPAELGTMQARFIAKATAISGEPRAALVAEVLRRSILEPTGRTIYSEHEDKFIILDILPTEEDLQRWGALTTS